MTHSSKKKVIVLGAGGTGLLMAESISNNRETTFSGFIDDSTEKQSSGYFGFPVLGSLASWREQPDDCSFLSSLYSPKKNKFFFDVITSLNIPESRWITVIDQEAIISKSATIGYGSYIGPGCIIEPMAHIGNYCVLLGNVYIAHHCHFAEYISCANSASIAGGVIVGEMSYIGANAAVREYIKIGSRTIVGMGSVVIRDVPDDQIVVGNPARVASK